MTDGARPPGHAAPDEPDPMLGRTLADRYRIEALVARGGMARVYRARDDRLERDVAVKVLARPYADDEAFRERFLGEARAVAGLSHPSLVHVYDSGSDGDAHYIVMELLDRHRTLRAVLSDRGALPVPEALRIGHELLAGLRAVHDHGLVHCDVKAANVMLGPGPAKLIDFGIAQPPHDGDDASTSIGTLQAMSPEQLHGEALTPASDLFSLGVVLYEAITGRVPYRATTPEELSAAHQAGGVAPPSSLVAGVGDRLDAVLLQSLRRDPLHRFRSAVAMLRALELSGAEATDDTTRVVRLPSRAAEPSARAGAGGYVPPPVPDVPPAASTRAPEPRRAVAPARRPPRRRSNLAGLVGTALTLGAAALVILLVVLPLLERGQPGDGSAEPSVAATARPSVARDVIPNVVGMPTDQAIDVAEAAGLNWTVNCAQDPQQPEGIIDQEPPAGTEVAPGSRFTMFSARIQDCR